MSSGFASPKGPGKLTHFQVSRLVRENLTQRALRFNVVLDDVSITHVAFSPEFTHAVEAKQVSHIRVT
jgi:regulator of protease activity HflC (stomatin/prohibitin superfamily)